LPRLELLHLRQHGAQLLRFDFPLRDVRIETCRRLAQRPEPPADPEEGCQHDEAGRDGQAVRRRYERAAALRALTVDREEVDANHRSPTRRSARPTATAAVGATSDGESTCSFFTSSPTRLNGSSPSTGASKRSVSISVKPSARDAPPLSMMRSMRSDAAVALKKSNVFWISSMTFSLTARSTGRASSNV